MLAEQVSYTRSQIQTRPNQTGLSPFSVGVHSRVNALRVRWHWGAGVCLLQQAGNPAEEIGLTVSQGGQRNAEAPTCHSSGLEAEVIEVRQLKAGRGIQREGLHAAKTPRGALTQHGGVAG